MFRQMGRVVVLGVWWLGAVACSSGGGGSGLAGGSLLSLCEGTYTCEAPGEDPVSTTLSSSEGGCYAGELLLQQDGSFELPDGESGTWSETVDGFRLCLGECLTCTRDGGPRAPEPSAGGHCVGSAMSCSSFGAGTCVQDGCSFVFEVQYDGSLKPDCSGSAKSCQYYDVDWECEGQQGCRWE